jgi:O-antigen/teichoic acid export membrane protein
LIVALALSIPQAFRVSYLRGRWHYTQVSLVGIIGSAAKLILGTALVLVGWRSFGAITGLALAQVVTLGVCLFWAHQAGFHGFGMRRTGHLPLRSLKPQLLYAGSVLLVSGSITIMQTLDVVAVKHYFTALQAGLYAGVTTIAGIVFFLMSPVVSVLITLVSLKQPPAKNRLQLQGSLVLMAVLGGAALLVMALFPETVIRALVGSKYLAYAPYLSRIGLFMMLLSLANAFTMYHIALSRYQYSFGAPAALAVTLGLLSVRHGSILAVINDLLLGSASVLFFTVMQSFIVHTRGISKHSTTGG